MGPWPCGPLTEAGLLHEGVCKPGNRPFPTAVFAGSFHQFKSNTVCRSPKKNKIHDSRLAKQRSLTTLRHERETFATVKRHLRRCLWRRCAGPRSSAVRARSGTGPPGPAAGTSFENERKMSIPARIAARQRLPVQFVSHSCQGPEQAGTGQAGTYSPAGSGAGQEWEQPGPRGSACGLGVLPLLAAAIGAASAAAYYAAAATTTA